MKEILKFASKVKLKAIKLNRVVRSTREILISLNANDLKEATAKLDRCIEEINSRYKVNKSKKITTPKRSSTNLKFGSLKLGKVYRTKTPQIYRVSKKETTS